MGLTWRVGAPFPGAEVRNESIAEWPGCQSDGYDVLLTRRPQSSATRRKPAQPQPAVQLVNTLAGWAPLFGVHAALLALLVLIAYANAFDSSFHFDDWALFNDPWITGGGLGLGIFRLDQTRPLTYWTLHVNHLAGGRSTFGYHFVNIFLHALNSILVLWIARRHLPRISALFAAGLFALHPLQTEAVTYVFARSSVLSTALALVSFVLFMRARLGWSIAAFALSLLAKEETLALPALMAFYDYFFLSRGNWRGVMRRAWYYAAMMALVVLAAARLFYVLAHTPDPTVGFRAGISTFTYLLTQARVLWRYLQLVVLPVGQNLDYDFRASASLVSPWTTLPALIAMVALLAALVWLAAKQKQAAFWALGFFVLISPTSSIVPQRDFIYEHRTYFPLFCLVIAIGWLAAKALARLKSDGPRIGAVFAVLLVCLVLTVLRNEVWATETSLWRDVTAKSPNKARPYLGMARALMENGRPNDARQALERGLQNDPKNYELRMNLAVLLLQLGDAAGSLEQSKLALAAGHHTPEMYNNMGAAYYRMGRMNDALAGFRRALEIDSCFYNARRNLAMSLSEAGRKDEGLKFLDMPGHCRVVPDQLQDLDRLRGEISKK